MKLILDEKLKHRLVGLAVIFSLGAIFAPAVMKKSSQSLENNFRVHVKLPPKPIIPGVVKKNEQELFGAIKVAHISIPSAKEELDESLQANSLLQSKDMSALASMIEKNISTQSAQIAANQVQEAVKVAATKPLIKPVVQAAAASLKKSEHPSVAVKPIAHKKPLVKKEMYSLQLGTFSKLTNAQSLVAQLKNKGYQARFATQIKTQGPQYKVYVGHSANKKEVEYLKGNLANSMKLDGIVVNTGVS